ncbi:hypothetical protein FKR81_33920 [Lentzea tibetensis]|uniref:Right handed beta helix domain-containing protein n=1 Tax=Lentzea tibetensis TaxID=2591470 RepID=A0A563EK36_9PSEU|nr:hypothetical protein [Lentzea tibetensis]TWP47046.1 hypothetical protein FKR81_33920 [Lentzea tibetensis]
MRTFAILAVLGTVLSLCPVASAGPELRGWELTTTNVGLAPHGLSCATLPEYTGDSKPAQGTVISAVQITTPLDLSNGDITVEKSCIQPTFTGYHNNFLVTTTICPDECSATEAGNVVIRDSEIDGSALTAAEVAKSCAFLGVGTLRRNYLHDTGSGICFFETGTEHSALAEQNYVRGLRSFDDSHNDGATVRDFRYAAGRSVTFRNNRIDCSTDNDTGALFIQPTWVEIQNLHVEGNYLEGGGYNLYLEETGDASYANVHAVDNRFRPTGWGPSANPSGPGWTTWQDNHLYDPAEPDGRGDVVSP